MNLLQLHKKMLSKMQDKRTPEDVQIAIAKSVIYRDKEGKNYTIFENFQRYNEAIEYAEKLKMAQGKAA